MREDLVKFPETVKLTVSVIPLENSSLLDTVIEPIIKELTDSGYSTNDWDLSGVLVMWAE